MPARRITAKSCSRNCTGISRRLASSPIGTGPSPERPSSARARSAYGLLVVMESIRSPSMLSGDVDAEGLAVAPVLELVAHRRARAAVVRRVDVADIGAGPAFV